MPKLTDADELAGLLSEVADRMCGMTFASWDPLARGESLSGRMVTMEMGEKRPIQITLSCDSRSSRALAAGMLGCSPAEVTPARSDGALRELLDVVAWKVAQKLRIEQRPSTPRPTTLAELAQMGGPGIEDGVLLRSQGDIDVRLWIFERSAEGGPAPDPAKGPSRFKSLVRRLIPRS